MVAHVDDASTASSELSSIADSPSPPSSPSSRGGRSPADAASAASLPRTLNPNAHAMIMAAYEDELALRKEELEEALYINGLGTILSGKPAPSAAAIGDSALQPTSVPSATPAQSKRKPRRKSDSPRIDRAGNPRTENARFLKRDATTGKLEDPKSGQDDYTQLQEIQDWIKEKRYTKFDLISRPSDFIIEDMDPDFTTDPNSLKNHGRKLLLGKNKVTEVWAVMPVADRLLMPRLIKCDRGDDKYTLVANIDALSENGMPALDFPFEAFKRGKKDEAKKKVAMTELHSVISYIFLNAREIKVAFSNSTKWPGALSTAVTHIKKMYAPDVEHPTAATVNRTIQSALDDDSEPDQLETLQDALRNKGLLNKVEAMVSDPTIFTFQNLKATVKAKNANKLGETALFLGQNDEKETWAFVPRNPNQTFLGLIINVDGETGQQTEVKYWDAMDWPLTFPFEPFRKKNDQMAFRKMQYVVGYVFLSCGVVDKALNLGKNLLGHFTNITKLVKDYYGSYSSPNDPADVFKPSSLQDDDDPMDVDDASAFSAPGPSTFGSSQRRGASHANKENAPDPANQDTRAARPGKRPMAINKAARARSSFRTALQSVSDPNNTVLNQKPRRMKKLFSLKGRYTAPAGEYRSLDDLHAALFLEETLNANGKRSANDNNEEENRAAKYVRVESARAAATKLRMGQEDIAAQAKHAMEEAQRVWQEAQGKIKLLNDCELDLAGQMGRASATMTDDDIVALPGLRRQ
ncbi:hypothetical protein BU23DRAFT_560585 [Bimuria novae-zelandiae CBS 107.79]|uniref:Uncharacterized protein n=1 Tax=Bimuria novae-zelandiae CBS 107.79 TaxID=1447943 RepID=A0A6A5USY3_9PLEO|nr:hypothetical protein BU23DRAFT_560585 [Bimuria novae-zelandiae CBS 107.79]